VKSETNILQIRIMSSTLPFAADDRQFPLWGVLWTRGWLSSGFPKIRRSGVVRTFPGRTCSPSVMVDKLGSVRPDMELRRTRTAKHGYACNLVTVCLPLALISNVEGIVVCFSTA